MISTSKVLPNFIKSAIKTALFVIAAAFSAVTFAGDHDAKDKIGDLKDMSSDTTTTKGEDIMSALSGDLDKEATEDDDAVKEEATDMVDALKPKMPEG